jgi:ribonuclease HII
MLKSRYLEDTHIEAGIDEAGRGCLWGPLVAGAVIWLPESEWTSELREVSQQIKDSKKLSAKKRKVLVEHIKNYAMDYAVGVVDASEIDSLGMSAANRLAFQRAISSLTVVPDRLIIDGILSIATEIQQHVEVEADGKYIPVAAASILAKETHDDYVIEACKKEPDLQHKYDIVSCKGYGTQKHRDGLKAHGKHSLHRRLFLRKLLGEQVEQKNEECLIMDDS